MLILHRKANESIEITVPPSNAPTLITVMVVGFQGQRGPIDTAKLGFSAPREVVIYRSEIADAIREETP